jgi:hypothetical protein
MYESLLEDLGGLKHNRWEVDVRISPPYVVFAVGPIVIPPELAFFSG